MTFLINMLVLGGRAFMKCYIMRVGILMNGLVP